MLWVGANNAPIITGISQTTYEIEYGDEFYLDLGYNDLDYGTSQSISAENLPSWLFLNENTGLLQGTPSAGDLGSDNIVLRVTDYRGQD